MGGMGGITREITENNWVLKNLQILKRVKKSTKNSLINYYH